MESFDHAVSAECGGCDGGPLHCQNGMQALRHLRTGKQKRVLTSWYWLAQGVSVLAWWLALWQIPALRGAFTSSAAPFAVLGAFAPGDLLLIAAGSCAVGLSRRAPWRVPLAWMIAGGVLYAAAYTFAAVLWASMPFLGALLMIPAAAGSIWAAGTLHAQSRGLLGEKRPQQGLP